jgi:transposase
MIRIDAMWLAAEPIDMRAGAERLLARVVQVFGVAQAHHGYLFANARGTRIKLTGHDPWAYLRDVLQRLPALPNSRLAELLPHRWTSARV